MRAPEGAGTPPQGPARRLTLALALLLAGTGVLRADDGDCDVPMDRWQPREAVEAMARDRGWTVARIRIDDGCYQLRGTGADGRPFKIKVDPETLEIVKARRGEWHGRAYGRGDGDDHALPPPPPTTPGPSAPSGPAGSAPNTADE